MNGFDVKEMSPRQFVTNVRSELERRDLGALADIDMEGTVLVFRVRWMGTSELCYQVMNNESGFSARLSAEKISRFHAPFKQKFIERFDQIIEAVGARSL